MKAVMMKKSRISVLSQPWRLMNLIMSAPRVLDDGHKVVNCILLGAAETLEHVPVVVGLVAVARGAPIVTAVRDRRENVGRHDLVAYLLLGFLAVQPIATGALAFLATANVALKLGVIVLRDVLEKPAVDAADVKTEMLHGGYSAACAIASATASSSQR
ncbi:hypothetical protein AAFG13_06750 [Bradyrhizobium sp. B124]|uniref:hypothetical protein n=1 Tax=Bradyrhizobium sp. B124 TaxID=3140245 RepID=UPI003182DFA5